MGWAGLVYNVERHAWMRRMIQARYDHKQVLGEQDERPNNRFGASEEGV